jgi:hypothetical protein
VCISQRCSRLLPSCVNFAVPDCMARLSASGHGVQGHGDAGLTIPCKACTSSRQSGTLHCRLQDNCHHILYRGGFFIALLQVAFSPVYLHRRLLDPFSPQSTVCRLPKGVAARVSSCTPHAPRAQGGTKNSGFPHTQGTTVHMDTWSYHHNADTP